MPCGTTPKIDLLASVRRHPLYILLRVEQGAVFLVNSRQRDFRCGPTCVGQALLRTYGRFFAEFLKDDSLVPLRLLASPTSVGLRYGDRALALLRFSRKALHNRWQGKFLTFRRRPLELGANDIKPIRHGCLFPSHADMIARPGWNINQLSIRLRFSPSP